MFASVFRGGTRGRDDVQHGTENGCLTVIKAQSAGETLKEPNTINSEGIYILYARILKETAHGIHIQQKGFLRNASR